MSFHDHEEFAHHVVSELRSAGYEALFAGGCVRDLLMGNTPDDYDVATSATPEQVRDLFGKRKTVAVGAAFGVIIVLAPNKQGGQVEVATFRSDASYSDGRRPDSVEFTTAQEDALRRDFTINGMFFDPLCERVIDYVEGQKDLKDKVIRAIGDAKARIAEDKLRMLRAIRFAARFGFEIERATRQAIIECADEVRIVSGERISVEVQKTLATLQSDWAVATWFDVGLMHALLPEVEATWPEVHTQAERLLNSIAAHQWHCKLAALLWLVDEEQAHDRVGGIQERWRLSNADAHRVSFALRALPHLKTAPNQPWAETQPWLVNPNSDAALELLRAMSQLEGDSTAIAWIEEQLLGVTELDPDPLVMGKDLIDQGFTPGPQFKNLLEQIRQMQLNRELKNREEALRWLELQRANS